MKKIFILVLFFVTVKSTYAQNNFIAIYSDSIKKNANAIISDDYTEIELVAIDKMIIKKRRVITVLNEFGLNSINAYEYFDKSTSIRKIEATVFNVFGAEIKKIKRKDFFESAVSGGSIITDTRVLNLKYTPVKYPFTVLFESELVTTNTSHIPSWYPVEDYFVTILKSSMRLKYNNTLKFKYKEINFNNEVKKVVNADELFYEIENVNAYKKEELAPSLRKLTPYVLFGLEEFNYEGVKGNASNWKVFGDWMCENLLNDTEEIDLKTVSDLKKIIGEEKDKIKIAQIIYKYMQDKTRYVSVQLGIGGWKPMKANDVNRLGYGDCKALTNYTRSLLKTFNIESYYTIVYSGDQKMDLQEDFVSMQGNHAILGIPNNNKITWLECTSQTKPFGFQGDFTDDRKVLIVSPSGSRIVKTQEYNNEQNIQKTKTKLEFIDTGAIKCNVNINSKGIIYDGKLGLELKSNSELIKYYNDELNNINNKKFDKIEVINDKESLFLQENINFTASEFVSKSGNRYIMPINIVNPVTFIPNTYKERYCPFEIDRGYYLEDEIEFVCPNTLLIESIPQDVDIQNEFGYYNLKLVKISETSLILKRNILIKKGFYEKEKYNQYQQFREIIAKTENLKIVILTN